MASTSAAASLTEAMVVSLPIEPATRPHKKRRRSRPGGATKPQDCKFLELPLELLTIIFELIVPYPRCLIALTRCNKYFRRVLLDKSSDRFWYASRNSFVPNPPKLPTELGFTEASYTFLLFDTEGVCEVCQKKTTVQYASFSLRLRLCTKTECKAEIRKPGILTQVRKNQAERLLKSVRRLERVNTLFPTDTFVCRSPEWSRNQRKYRDRPKEFSPGPSMLVYNEFCDNVYEWAQQQECIAKEFLSGNKQTTAMFAERHGATIGDLKSIPAYKALLWECANLRDALEPEALERVANEVRAGLQRMRERGQNRSYEKNYETFRTKMWESYALLQGDQDIKPCPSWRTFFRLPIIASYVELLAKEKPPHDDIIRFAESQDFQEALRLQINAWVASSRETLLHTLGITAAPRPADVLPILESLTSRFRCSPCNLKQPLAGSDNGSFDFLGVCGHNCRSPEKEGKTWEWKASNFVKDERASQALEKMLIACQTSACDPRCSEVLKSIGGRILCQSCEQSVVMQPEAVAAHSQRHANMELKLLTEDEVLQVRKHPLIPGLSKRLLSLGQFPKESDVRMRKIFVCIHCPSRLHPFTLHGLRSHMLIKHDIRDLPDEDYYTCEAIDLEDTSPQ